MNVAQIHSLQVNPEPLNYPSWVLLALGLAIVALIVMLARRKK